MYWPSRSHFFLVYLGADLQISPPKNVLKRIENKETTLLSWSSQWLSLQLMITYFLTEWTTHNFFPMAEKSSSIWFIMVACWTSKKDGGNILSSVWNLNTCQIYGLLITTKGIREKDSTPQFVLIKDDAEQKLARLWYLVTINNRVIMLTNACVQVSGVDQWAMTLKGYLYKLLWLV